MHRMSNPTLPDLVAYSDAYPTGDQEVAGVTQHSFMEIDDETFSTVHFADSRKAVVSLWWKNMHKYWLTT